MTRSVENLELALAAELDHARDMLVMLGDELALNEQVVTEHGFALQSIDIVGQMLGHLANVVRADDRDAAVHRIGMCELKAKLSAAA